MLIRSLIVFVLCLASLPQDSFAQQRQASSTATNNVNHTPPPAGLGVADTGNISTSQSLSALFKSKKDWVQVFLGVNRARDPFEFGAGAAYKFTVGGDQRTGFHIGPALKFGTQGVASGSEFAVSLSGLMGAHFTVFEKMMISVDGGPILSVVDGRFDFQLKPAGDLLGLAVYYMF